MTPTSEKGSKGDKLPLPKILGSGKAQTRHKRESYDYAARRVDISRETLRKVEFIERHGTEEQKQEGRLGEESVDALYTEIKSAMRRERSPPPPPIVKLEHEDYHVYCRDLEKGSMKEVGDGTVHLIVTSPPYNNATPYDVWDDSLPLPRYKKLIRKVLGECYRKLIEGGRAALVVPMATKIEDDVIFMPLLYSGIIKKCHFKFRDAIVWQKSEEFTIPEGTAWGSWCSPSNPVMRSVSEFILIAHKKTPELGGKDPDIQPDEFREWTRDIWPIPPVSSRINPSVFPEELVKRLIKLYSYPGQLVLDPFAGEGTAGVACVKLRRKFTGYDISPEYCGWAKKYIADALGEVDGG